MTLGLSTSGPYAIVAGFDASGKLIARGKLESKRAASGAVLALMDELELGVPNRIVVDVGPGSFTGVRVGVTMAKVWAQAWSVPIFGVTAFDLVAEGAVAIPSKRGEVYVRVPGAEPTTMKVEDAEVIAGITMAGESELGDLFQFLPSNLMEATAVELVPLYVANPSISQAKQSHIMGETFGGRQNV